MTTRCYVRFNMDEFQSYLSESTQGNLTRGDVESWLEARNFAKYKHSDYWVTTRDGIRILETAPAEIATTVTFDRPPRDKIRNSARGAPWQIYFWLVLVITCSRLFMYGSVLTRSFNMHVYSEDDAVAALAGIGVGSLALILPLYSWVYGRRFNILSRNPGIMKALMMLVGIVSVIGTGTTPGIIRCVFLGPAVYVFYRMGWKKEP